MEIDRDEAQKIISVWLTKQESRDRSLLERLKPYYAKWKAEKYLVAVYHSGTRDLYQSTLDLLIHNKKRCAELEVQRAKAQRGERQWEMQL